MTDQAAKEQAADDLHRDIMNLPCKLHEYPNYTDGEKIAHQQGHRDARHAAAELVAARASSLVAMTDEQIDAIVKSVFPPDRDSHYDIWLREVGRPIARAVLAAAPPSPGAAQGMEPVAQKPGWFLSYDAVSHLPSLPKLIEHAKRAHYTNAIVRKDGKETVYEADWIKHLRWVDVAASPPESPAPAREAQDKAPDEIWLQIDQESPDVDDCTWCRDKINDTDVRYVRAALSPSSPGAQRPEKHRCSAHPHHNPDCQDCVAQNTSEDASGMNSVASVGVQEEQKP
jgi:hypothetical protein